MAPGTTIVANVGGKTLTGTILFANERIITLDQGNGITAIFRFDIAGNRWMFGRMTATFAPAKTFSERLAEVAALARYKPASGKIRTGRF